MFVPLKNDDEEVTVKLVLLASLVFCNLGQICCQTNICACDLTQNACDPNCCCDAECTNADKNAFTFCKNIDLNQDDRVCLSNQIIEIANVKYRTTGTAKGLFCIYTDNNAARNFYTNVQTATTTTRFDELLRTYRKTSFITSPMASETYLSSSDYKFGDPILLLFESNIQGFLAFPKPSVGSSQCDDRNAAGFMKDETSKCSRPIRDLATQCINDNSYNALSYYSGFKFVPGPSFLATVTLYKVENITVTASVVQPTPSLIQVVSSPIASLTANISATASSVLSPSPTPSPSVTPNVTVNTTTRAIVTLATYNDSLLVNATLLQPVICMTSTGVKGSCDFNAPPKPTYDFTTNTCKNVVAKVSYTVLYGDGNTTSLNISSVNVNLELGDITSTAKSFNQEFTIKFQKVGSQSTFTRSGNPGYVKGREIIAGTLQVNSQQKKEVIVLNKDPKQWFTLVQSSASNACGTSSQRMPVKFGVNMRTGCFVNIKRAMTSQECSLLQNTIYNSLLGTFPSHVAMYGNSAVTNTADWVKIINSRPQLTPTAVSGQCTNMVLGIHFEILHSKTGYFANPQYRIVGVQVKYDPGRVLNFLCTGRYCQPGSSSLVTQKVEVTQSVSFVDVSTTPEAQMKPKPTFEAKAPYDFFYPFV